MLFDPTRGQHSNTIDGIADGSDWRGSCAHMGRWLADKGYITWNYFCERHCLLFGCTSISLVYTPREDWDYVSNNHINTNDATNFQCDDYIAHKGDWCSSISEHITKTQCNDVPYLKCSSESDFKKCSDWTTSPLSECPCVDSPLDWKDSAGDRCGWYSSGDNCETYGNWGDTETTANEACCTCGGGDRGGTNEKEANIGDSISHYNKRDTVATLG